jgi:hypothetical protein
VMGSEGKNEQKEERRVSIREKKGYATTTSRDPTLNLPVKKQKENMLLVLLMLLPLP